MMELPDYKLPRLKSIALGLYMRAKMFLHRAGTTDLLDDGVDLVPGVVPLPPAGAEGPAINYSLAAMIGRTIEPVLAPARLQLADRGGADSGHGRAGSRGPPPLGTVYAIEGGKEAARQIGQALANPLERGDGACRCWSGTFSRRNAPRPWR